MMRVLDDYAAALHHITALEAQLAAVTRERDALVKFYLAVDEAKVGLSAALTPPSSDGGGGSCGYGGGEPQ